MVQTRNIAKRQKTEECAPFMESVMFNSDSLFKIVSYLPADCLLNLALTSRRFGVAPVSDDDGDDSLSLIEETARRIVQDIATEEQKNALPNYDGDNWLSKYNYLQLLRAPLAFDQLVGEIEYYVEGNKTRVVNRQDWAATAFSNNIMMAGKHYASFEASNGRGLFLGVMRPGEAMQSAKGGPLIWPLYRNFTQQKESRQYNNTVNCCMYDAYNGECCSSDWGEGATIIEYWDGMEELSGCHKVGMLLDLDEGTLSVYKNDRRLGVMKRGLEGHYCWVVGLAGCAAGNQITIKRGTVPEN